MTDIVIVTRHAGAVEWLKGKGIEGEVIDHATGADVAGKVVVGALPLHLAAKATKIGSIDMPGMTPEQRGKDLTPAEMDAAGASISWYTVSAAAAPERPVTAAPAGYREAVMVSAYIGSHHEYGEGDIEWPIAVPDGDPDPEGTTHGHHGPGGEWRKWADRYPSVLVYDDELVPAQQWAADRAD